MESTMPEARLDGWKEIADHLKVSARTAQRMEGVGLPVHRLPAPSDSQVKKQRVYAFKSEIDAWLRSAPAGIEEVARADAPPFAPSRRRALWVGAAVLVVALGGGAAFLLFRRPREPVSAAILPGNKFVVLAEDGAVLWSKQFAGYLSPSTQSWRVIDLDGDSRKEVLLAAREERNNAPDEHSLVCFNGDGSVRWRYVPGGPVRWNGFDYPNQYQMGDFSAEGRLKGGRRFTAVLANHRPYYPAQLSVLDPEGHVIGEYWNTGYLWTLDVIDVDGDGQDEIALGGINNVHHGPALAIVDHDLKRAISPVPDGFAPSFERGRERAYVLLPRTDAADVLGVDSRVKKVVRSAEDHLEVSLEIADGSHTSERLYYLDRRLHPQRLDFLENFVALHKRLEQEGRLDHALDESEKGRLMRFEHLR